MALVDGTDRVSLSRKGNASHVQKKKKKLLPTLILSSALSIPKPDLCTFQAACCFYMPLP